MAVPSPISIKKNGVLYVSRVDRAKYTIAELSRAALKDVGKFLRKRMIENAKKLKGLKRSRRPYRAFQTWVRKRDGNLQVGIGNTKKNLSGDTWYGIQQELGTSNQPKRGILRETVLENIDEIRRIEGMYLQAIEDENRAFGLIDEEEELGDGDI